MRTVEDDVKQMASLGAAAVFGAGAAYASVQAKKKRDSGAVVDLYNAIVDLPDPSALTSDVVDTVGSKYGINMQKDDIDSLVRIYGQYLENLIPTGDTQLRCDRQRRAEYHAAAAVAAAAPAAAPAAATAVATAPPAAAPAAPAAPAPAPAAAVGHVSFGAAGHLVQGLPRTHPPLNPVRLNPSPYSPTKVCNPSFPFPTLLASQG